MRRDIVVTNLLALGSLFLVAVFWRWSFLTLILLVIISLVLLVMRKQKSEYYLFLFCGLVGALAEMFAASFGAWTYGYPDFFNIPYWLFVLWGIAGVYMARMHKFFEAYVKK